MLETLAVIAVIAILSVTALSGYRKIVARFEANSIAKAIQTLVLERRQKVGFSRGEDLQTINVGTHDSEVTIKNGISEAENNYLIVQVNTHQNPELCEELQNVSFLKQASSDAEKTLSTLPVSVAGECPEPLKFYYDKYVGFKSIKEEVDNSFKEITEKYIEKISNENNIINIDKLFDEYLIECRNIFMDDYEKSNENININISSNKFKIYYSSFPSDKNIKYFNDHPVLFGFYKAWVNHCPITITPNMIWQLILNVFIKYVDLNSEKLRNKFVNFEGKKVLEVFQIIQDTINLIPNKEEWEKIIDNLIIKIGENTGNYVLDEFILDFTTNDKNLLFVQKVSVMAMFKKYFEYKAILGITCGYPYINLEGTIKDWILIKNKLNDFKKYGLKDWINSINYIIDEIINTKKGKINYDFWKDILFEHFGQYHEVYEGKIKYIIFTGWLSKFFYFNNKGNEIFGHIKMEYSSNASSDNPLSEFSITPLKVVFPGNKEKELKILSGIIGISQDPNTLCVRPELGFFIVDEKWGKDKN